MHLVANNVVFYLEHPEQRESYTNVERHAIVFFKRSKRIKRIKGINGLPLGLKPRGLRGVKLPLVVLRRYLFLSSTTPPFQTVYPVFASRSTYSLTLKRMVSATLTPYWRTDGMFFTQTTLPLSSPRTRGFLSTSRASFHDKLLLGSGGLKGTFSPPLHSIAPTHPKIALPSLNQISRYQRRLHGLKSRTPVPTKSLSLRVTSVHP